MVVICLSSFLTVVNRGGLVDQMAGFDDSQTGMAADGLRIEFENESAVLLFVGPLDIS